LEKQRGIISQTAIRATANSKLPAYFIGKRRLAGRMPVAVGYDSLRHQCLEYYRDFIGYHQEGIINADDLEYRAKLVLARLPRAIVADGPRISNHELIVITKELSSYFGNKKKYYLISKPLLVLARCPVVKWFFCVLKKVNRLRKQLRNTVYG